MGIALRTFTSIIKSLFHSMYVTEDDFDLSYIYAYSSYSDLENKIPFVTLGVSYDPEKEIASSRLPLNHCYKKLCFKIRVSRKFAEATLVEILNKDVILNAVPGPVSGTVLIDPSVEHTLMYIFGNLIELESRSLNFQRIVEIRRSIN